MADSKSETEISWQTAWWALIPLATTCMLQPCGNILGVRNGSRVARFCGRASPIICLADTAHALFTLLLCVTPDRVAFIDNVKTRTTFLWLDSAAKGLDLKVMEKLMGVKARFRPRVKMKDE
ncbi:hypothetical protein QBC34DRAFT_430259 [Podospora aff. communis PSN243]|uniref:Uncharacterized protein n=1 Tax=Podospora aff. communis PSN243 TaxID=3040156 RepID=A0AAV9G841_9PEZI|nr:hypothetical protein QBC34DRAFT_430259 [Podospora aff. communis PSN243]